jgi:hypothetical protein
MPCSSLCRLEVEKPNVRTVFRASCSQCWMEGGGGVESAREGLRQVGLGLCLGVVSGGLLGLSDRCFLKCPKAL